MVVENGDIFFLEHYYHWWFVNFAAINIRREYFVSKSRGKWEEKLNWEMSFCRIFEIDTEGEVGYEVSIIYKIQISQPFLFFFLTSLYLSLYLFYFYFLKKKKGENPLNHQPKNFYPNSRSKKWISSRVFRRGFNFLCASSSWLSLEKLYNLRGPIIYAWSINITHVLVSEQRIHSNSLEIR